MEAISYYPDDPAAKLELRRRAAEIHARFAASDIAKLNCPKEQKVELLYAVIQAAEKAAMSELQMKSSCISATRKKPPRMSP